MIINDRKFSNDRIEGLNNIYLGSDISSYDSKKQIKNFTNSKVISELKLPFSEGIKNVSDSIYCLFENILGGLTDTIGKFLKTLIGKIVNAPICAAEQFMGALLNDITKIVVVKIKIVIITKSPTVIPLSFKFIRKIDFL